MVPALQPDPKGLWPHLVDGKSSDATPSGAGKRSIEPKSGSGS